MSSLDLPGGAILCLLTLEVESIPVTRRVATEDPLRSGFGVGIVVLSIECDS